MSVLTASLVSLLWKFNFSSFELSWLVLVRDQNIETYKAQKCKWVTKTTKAVNFLNQNFTIGRLGILLIHEYWILSKWTFKVVFYVWFNTANSDFSANSDGISSFEVKIFDLMVYFFIDLMSFDYYNIRFFIGSNKELIFGNIRHNLRYLSLVLSFPKKLRVLSRHSEVLYRQVISWEKHRIMKQSYA